MIRFVGPLLIFIISLFRIFKRCINSSKPIIPKSSNPINNNVKRLQLPAAYGHLRARYLFMSSPSNPGLSPLPSQEPAAVLNRRKNNIIPMGGGGNQAAFLLPTRVQRILRDIPALGLLQTSIAASGRREAVFSVPGAAAIQHNNHKTEFRKSVKPVLQVQQRVPRDQQPWQQFPKPRGVSSDQGGQRLFIYPFVLRHPARLPVHQKPPQAAFKSDLSGHERKQPNDHLRRLQPPQPCLQPK